MRDSCSAVVPEIRHVDFTRDTTSRVVERSALIRPRTTVSHVPYSFGEIRAGGRCSL